jgi:RNA polymerase sigma factor (sigma-70 family)
MATGELSGVIQLLRRATLLRDGAGLTDGQLLGDYLSRRDQAALAALVRRHGSMVWGVCRRVLRNYHDAEDAFQATFLVLVRKAAAIASPELLANWLYGVAYQTARKARSTLARRKVRERQVAEMPEPASAEQDLWDDLQLLLDQELSRLPELHRAVLVLCDLEGKTRKEAARHLGLPEGTVGSRLARARGLLAKRLTERGVALSGGALAALLAQNVASAGVPDSVASSTISAASCFAAGQAATGPVSVKVAALAEGVVRAMLIGKLKAVVAVVLVLGVVAAGATVFARRTTAEDGIQPPASDASVTLPPKQEKKKEPFTAWGKEVGGLQAGVGFRLGGYRAYRLGEAVTLVVRVRNVSKKEIEFAYLKQFFLETPPVVTDVNGKPIPANPFPKAGGERVLTKVGLAPGKEIELYEWKLKLRPDMEDLVTLGLFIKANIVCPDCLWMGGGVGHVGVQFEKLAGPDTDNILSKLATGKLELEVKDAEGVTAWGKELGGLQAGLRFHPGEKRAYRYGETVRVAISIRNVGKEAVEFKHIWAFFVENAPTMRDPNGQVVRLPRLSAEGLQMPRSTTVAPGEEVELYEWMFDLEKRWAEFHGTGTFSLQCERVVGPTSGNPNHPNPAMAKLATGKLELEVKDAPEDVTAWGKEVGGLQAGLSLRPSEKRAYSHGETVTLVVRVRNVGKETVKFEYIRQFLDEQPPTVTNADGKAVPQIGIEMLGFHPATEVTLEPGKEIELESRLAGGPKRAGAPGIRYKLEPALGTGKVSFQYERVLGDSSVGKIKIDPALRKLATGKLELEIQSDPPAASEKK